MRIPAMKIMGAIAAAALASSLAVFAGCTPAASSGSASSNASAASESASASESSAAVSSGAAESASSEASSNASIANPWSEAASAEEAAKGAGIDSFSLPEGPIADLGEPIAVTYRYMDGMAEARFEFPASAVTARTAAISEGDFFDISGDYNTYANEWTENVAGASVACAGNRKGESTKTYWGDEGVAHSLVAEGLGGDDDFGLTADRLAVFVGAMN